MEDWKIKIAVLWIVFECGSLAIGMVEFLTPGVIEGIIEGEMLGWELTSEVALLFAIIFARAHREIFREVEKHSGEIIVKG